MIYFNIYQATAIVMFILSLMTMKYNSVNAKIKQILLFLIAWLIFYEGFRWEIGTDWSYYDEFMYGYDDSVFSTEAGYVFISSLFRKLFGHYTVFLLAITVFFYVTIYKIIKKYSCFPVASLCIYYCSMIGYLGCNRQFIAMMICLLSIKYVLDSDWKKFLICILIASSFHVSSVIFIFSYIFYKYEMKNVYLIGLILITLVIGLTGVVNSMPYIDYIVLLDGNTANKLDYYYENSQGEVYSAIGTLKRLLILVPCFYFKDKEIENHNRLFMKLYILGAMMYFCFNGSKLELLAGRGAMYFNVAEMIVMPFLIKRVISNKLVSYVAWAIYFGILLYLMLRDMNYHTSAGNLIYLPYKNILFL